MSTPATAAQPQVNESELLEKLAAFEDGLVSEVYVPAFIESFNKQAAACGLEPLTNADQVVRALELSAVVEAELRRDEAKQASAGGTGHGALDLASALVLTKSASPAPVVASDRLRSAYEQLAALVTASN